MHKPLLKLSVLGAFSFLAATALQAQILSYNFNQPSGPTNAGTAGASGNLTYSSPASASASGAGVTGQAGDYAYTGSSTFSSNAGTASAIGGLNGGQKITVTGWMKLNAFGDDQDILSTQSGYQNGFKVSLSTNNEIQFFDPEYNHLVSSTSGIYGNALSQWVFFAVSWDATATQATAVNFYYGTTSTSASLVSTTARSNVSTLGNNTDPFLIGNSYNLPGYQFWDAINGSLDNIAVYTSILDGSQIEAVRASTFVPEPGTATMLGLGLFGTLWMSRRRKTAR